MINKVIITLAGNALFILMKYFLDLQFKLKMLFNIDKNLDLQFILFYVYTIDII